TDHIMRGLIWAGAIVALIPLVLVIYYILKKGLGVISGSLFTTDPTGATFGTDISVLGGIKSAILGTLEMIALATLIRYLIDVMTGVPSVVFGLFIYVTLVESQVGGSGFAGWKGAIAISLLM